MKEGDIMNEEITISKIEYDYLRVTEFKYKTLYNCLLDNAEMELWDNELRFRYDKLKETFISLESNECKNKYGELKLLKEKEKQGEDNI